MKLTVLLVTSFLLGGCAIVPLGYGHHDRGDRGDTWAAAKGQAREVVNPADIPVGFIGCTGSHHATGEATKTERGVGVYINDSNRRRCPEARLN